MMSMVLGISHWPSTMLPNSCSLACSVAQVPHLSFQRIPFLKTANPKNEPRKTLGSRTNKSVPTTLPIKSRLQPMLLHCGLALLLASTPPSDAAAIIKMGADEGTLNFVPSSISVSSGEKITFINNKGFPHNVIFEKDGVPPGVQADAISHGDYMNNPGEQFTVILKEKGIYRFYCEPHKDAKMFGEITVN